jgi:hypothetical protein
MKAAWELESDMKETHPKLFKGLGMWSLED